MENWRMSGVFNRFEETQKYAKLCKGNSVSLLLYILWSTASSSDATWDTNAAEIMSKCKIAWVQLLVYIDFVQTVAHNNNPQLLLVILGSAGNVRHFCWRCLCLKHVSAGFGEDKILSPYWLHLFPDLAITKPFHFWLQVIHWARIPTSSLICREMALDLGEY